MLPGLIAILGNIKIQCMIHGQDLALGKSFFEGLSFWTSKPKVAGSIESAPLAGWLADHKGQKITKQFLGKKLASPIITKMCEK